MERWAMDDEIEAPVHVGTCMRARTHCERAGHMHNAHARAPRQHTARHCPEPPSAAPSRMNAPTCTRMRAGAHARRRAGATHTCSCLRADTRARRHVARACGRVLLVF
eukprot:9978945-Alexandrium_andersonii.AAC.1